MPVAVSALYGEDLELLTQMSLQANRPLNWNLVAPSSEAPEVMESQLAASDYAAERGARVLALTVPQEIRGRINLLGGGEERGEGYLLRRVQQRRVRDQSLGDSGACAP